ncbi:MAG: AMP-binding protein, partial [Actinomycetota bacterium]
MRSERWGIQMHDIFNASTWLLDRNVDDGRGDHPAVRCRGATTSYADLLELTERVATGLRTRGVRPEERVAMVMLDSVDFVATFLGAMRIGAVPVLTNPLLPGRDLAVIIADSRARRLVISGDRVGALDDLRAGCPELDDVIVSGSDDWSALVAADDDGEPYDTWRDSPGFWLCTSGTTGRPKLAMHTHGDLPDTCTTYAANVLDIGPDDRCFSVGPM